MSHLQLHFFFPCALNVMTGPSHHRIRQSTETLSIHRIRVFVNHHFASYIYNFRKVGNGALVQGHKHYLQRKHWVIKAVTTESLARRSVVIMNDSGPLRYRPLTVFFTNLAVFKNGYKSFRCGVHLLFKPAGRFKERHSGRMKQSACTRFLLGQAEPVPCLRSEMQIRVFTPYRPAALLAGSFVP